MKNLLLSALAVLLVATTAGAQDTPRNYHRFTDIVSVAYTPVKDQSRSGTCWSFAALALFESELLREGKGEHDLSAMWVARHTYYEKAVRYVRMHGTIILAAGGAWDDVPMVIRKYGIVPTEVYTGLNYGTENHNHAELDAVIKAYCDAVIKSSRLSTAWQNGLNGILDAYFGPVPERFTYQGREYTPESFTKMLGLNMDDYVCFTSFTHHPFYTWFSIEVPDNWAWSTTFNIPQDELLAITEGALEKGYSLFWASDVSEPGFVYMRGLAFNVPARVESAEGTELARWVSVSSARRTEMVGRLLEGRIDEPTFTQEERQMAFDNYETTDDHGMQLVGIATDQDGRRYFRVKNSWGETGVYNGFFYVSYPYFKYKTMEIAMHKDAVPAALRAKLGTR
ncbi:MAG: aminopeptidase [Rikenellaceae bacterium]|nr:aminopeptidase [Rikenellaceae bacterium]MCL2692781.1 aminopeptidase [Rikenellaceae bacterium]